MGWRSQVLLGRLRDQTAVLATAAVVAFAATTLLGTFAFLVDVTGQDAVDAALSRAPAADLALEAVVDVGDRDVRATLAAAEDTLRSTLGDLPYDRDVWLTGHLWRVAPADGTGAQRPLAYPLSTPQVPEHANLLSGGWPARPRDDAGRLEVNVPAVAAERYGWRVGSEVPVSTIGNARTDTWLVVGTHELTGPAVTWSRDPLDGAGHARDFPVPGSRGYSTTDAWGPVVVAADALLEPGAAQRIHLLATPDLSAAPRGELAQARDRLAAAQPLLSAALQPVRAVGTVQTRLGETVDGAVRQLAVTRVSVTVAGLLLAVLATTVMLLAARAVAERRRGDGALLVARGATPAQLRSPAVVEACVLAAVVTAAAPWAARVAFTRLLESSALGAAGVRVPPGVPGPVWLACGAAALVLAVVLVVPAWHTRGSSRRSPHARLVGAGTDVGLVVLGAVTLQQLLAHGGPLTHGTSAARLDPVLVAGPAVVTLAVAVLSLRLVGPVARGVDALASRSTSLLAPLTAWQVSRRTVTATATTLVVVLAVATATFAQAFAATWRVSQLEQVDLAVGTDIRFAGSRTEPLTDSADVRTALEQAPDGTRPQAVTDRGGTVGGSRSSATPTYGLDTRLTGVDTRHPEALRGRVDPSWATVLDGLAGEPSDAATTGATGVPLPGDPQWLTARVVPLAGPDLEGTALVMLAVEDDAGVHAWLTASVTDTTDPSTVAVEVPRARGQLRVVALRAVLTSGPAPPRAANVANAPPPLGALGVAVGDVRVLDRTARLTSLDAALEARERGARVDLRDTSWHAGTGTGATAAGLRTDRAGLDAAAAVPPDALVLRGTFDLEVAAQGGALLAAHSWPPVGPVPVVMTDALAERAEITVGAEFRLGTGDGVVRARATALVPYVPGTPRGPAVLADRTALARAAVEAGGTDPLVDAWWLTAPDVTAARTAAQLADALGATPTVRVTARDEAVTGALSSSVPAALGLVTVATALLALVGLGASAAASVRSRRLELARLQALGAARPTLVTGLVGEHALLVALGSTTGLVVGYVLTRVVAPLLTVSPDGAAPVPQPVPAWHAGPVLLLTAGLALGACAVVGGLAALLVRRASGALLRMGDDR